MITTSRYVSKKTREFAKSLAREGNERYVARGKKTIDSLVDDARKKGEESIGVIEERGGEATLLARIKVDERGRWSWAGERLLKMTEKKDG
jgi:rRNA maturation protein Rpf1